MSNFKKNMLGGLPFTTIPDYFLSQIMTQLSHSELRVMLYIYLHTLGYGKLEDDISYQQFTSGIITREGCRLDYGAGVSRRALVTALLGLENKGLIRRSSKGYSVARFKLNLPTTSENPTAVQHSPALETISKSNEPNPQVQGLHLQAVENLVEVQSLPGTTVCEVQGLHFTEEPNQKHENHDRVVTLTKLIKDKIPDITHKDAAALVQIASANGRDESYLERLITHVATNPSIRVPAAVLTTLIKTNQDRSAASFPTIPHKGEDTRVRLKPNSYSKQHRGSSAKSNNSSGINFAKYAELLADKPSFEGVEAPDDITNSSVSDATWSSRTGSTSSVNSWLIDERLRYALHIQAPSSAAYLRQLEVKDHLVVVRFMGNISPDLSWWLPEIQRYYPTVSEIKVLH